MITLITGAPGSGKTLYCVDKLIAPMVGKTVQFENDSGERVTAERRIYSNIPGLMLDHEQVDADWLRSLRSNATPGGFVVFDEVQRVWPNRPSQSKKPEAVEYLETHRHDGIDIVLLTQNPMLLDPAVRKLVGRHLHMRRVGGMKAAIVYEWDACSDQLRFNAAFTKSPYKYSKRAFQLYHSARVHTKQKRRLPFAVWLALGGVVGSAVAWPMFAGRIFGERAPTVQAVNEAPEEKYVRPYADVQAVRSATVADDVLMLDELSSGARVVMTVEEYMASYEPRIDALPHTAPRYDGLTRPTVAPFPVACLVMEDQGCKCYSQQATVISMDQGICLEIVQNGLFKDFGDGSRGVADPPVMRTISDDSPGLLVLQ